jgi:IS1 family transposase
VKVAGQWRYIYHAIDQFGQVIDAFVSARRDAKAARRFFEWAIGTTKITPAEVVTDHAPVYPIVLEELLPAAWHRTDRYANNRIEAVRAAAGCERCGGAGTSPWPAGPGRAVERVQGVVARPSIRDRELAWR